MNENKAYENLKKQVEKLAKRVEEIEKRLSNLEKASDDDPNVKKEKKTQENKQEEGKEISTEHNYLKRTINEAKKRYEKEQTF